MEQMAAYRTAAPKGVFRYATHEEANRARESWTVAKALSLLGTPEVCGAG
ncbi:MAG TPA: hypothetical protein PKA88_05180 [Polyangiaceae bacterium]|nr:hypothetical protein [Polyangiaceae bacterium]